MPTDQNLLTVLIVSLVAVFIAVVVLIYYVREHGAAIRKLQPGSGETFETVSAAAPKAGLAAANAFTETGIPEEVIAAIAAAVYVTYGVSADSITSIRRVNARPARGAWQMAGLLENTRPF